MKTFEIKKEYSLTYIFDKEVISNDDGAYD